MFFSLYFVNFGDFGSLYSTRIGLSEKNWVFIHQKKFLYIFSLLKNHGFFFFAILDLRKNFHIGKISFFIISGFIIDAFGALRDQMQGVEDELANNCFICGIGKDYLDSVPHGFDIHVQKEHNLANYL